MVAFYLRLSKEERRRGQGNSLLSQRKLLEQWIQKEPDLGKESVCIFSDNGYSGMREKRPEFEIMLAKILTGQIKTLVVKDFSRLTRDHLLLSELREELFPALDVVFISIGDRYDSRNQGSWELDMSFRSLFYEYYCHDISRKVKKALEAKKEAGVYATARVPFGYRREKETGNWIPEPKEAEQIRQMFQMALTGESYQTIGKHYQMDASRVWYILHNPVYMGCQVWHKSESRLGGLAPTQYLDQRQWYYRPYRHPAIVSEEMFTQIESHSRQTSAKKGKRHLFHGITKCMECGRALCMDRRKKGILCCNHCSRKEEKRITVQELLEICRTEWFRQVYDCDCLSSAEAKIDLSPELFLQEMILRIKVGCHHNIEIVWNFQKSMDDSFYMD